MHRSNLLLTASRKRTAESDADDTEEGNSEKVQLPPDATLEEIADEKAECAERG